MRRAPTDRYSLSWHERVIRGGPGRRQLLVGSEVFRPTELPRLMQRAQELAGAGYLISITPPSIAPEAA
jgi:hypothetical protein